MKILQIIPFLSPKFGGTISVLDQLTKEFVKNNHSVTILTSDLELDKKLVKKFEESGITIIPIHVVLNIGLFIYTPSVKKWVVENLKSFDIIHMHTFRSYQNNIVSKYAKQYRIPYIVQAHGSVLPFFEKQNLKKMYDYVWGDKMLHFASKVIALTNTESEQYQKMGVPRNKIEIIPNGLDLSQFLDIPQKGKFKSKYQIPEKEKVILFLGRIHRIKGIDLLISAYPEILKEFPDAQLVIVGPDDNYLSIIQEHIAQLKINKKPLFTGALYGLEKLEAYVDADVYVLPSLYETFPMTLLEAMVCGTPVIITNNIKNFDWIQNKSGYIIENDPDDLVRQISVLFNDETLRQSLGENGKELVKTTFNFTPMILSTEKLYLQTIRESVENT